MKEIFLKTPLSDVYLINHFESRDERGLFIKQYSHHSKENSIINFIAEESFTTLSKKNVLRGMHCQTGIASHKKLITCVRGKILDVIVDIRKNSNQFNKPFSVELNDKKQQSLLIGIGYAHGFLCLEENSIVQYITSKSYVKNLDNGVHWKSIDFDWPIKQPLISERDNSLPNINDQEYRFK